VWSTILEARPDCRVELVPRAYNHQRLVAEMRAEQLPEDSVETVLTGW
jgi:hypothetical protein